MHQQLDLLPTTNQQRRSLVQAGGWNVENVARPIGSHTAGLFGEEGNGIRFIQEPKLAARVLARWRIEKDTALQERTVKVGHEGTDIPRGVGPSCFAGTQMS